MIGPLQDKMKHLSLPKGDVCIAKDDIANLFVHGEILKEGYRIQIEFDVENTINVFNEDRSYIKFVCVQDGLYWINLDNSDERVNYFTTVSKQKNHFQQYVHNTKVTTCVSHW